MQSNQIKKVTIAFVLVLSAIVIIILCGSQLVFQKACIRKNRPWPDLGAADKKQFELLTDAYKIKNIPSEQITINASDGIKLTGNYYEREKNAPFVIFMIPQVVGVVVVLLELAAVMLRQAWYI